MFVANCIKGHVLLTLTDHDLETDLEISKRVLRTRLLYDLEQLRGGAGQGPTSDGRGSVQPAQAAARPSQPHQPVQTPSQPAPPPRHGSSSAVSWMPRLWLVGVLPSLTDVSLSPAGPTHLIPRQPAPSWAAARVWPQPVPHLRPRRGLRPPPVCGRGLCGGSGTPGQTLS